MVDGKVTEVILEHQGRISRIEQKTNDLDQRVSALEKKQDKIYQMQWVILATILSSVVGGIIVAYAAKLI